MLNIAVYNEILIAMAIIGLIVFIALFFVSAGYGMLFNRKWGISINNRLGWVVMEIPVVIAMTWLWLSSERTLQPVPLLFFVLFQLHYFQRTFIFPFRIKGKNRMPLLIVAMGVVFNLINATLIGGWIFFLAPADAYTTNWLFTPQFIAGITIFFLGMATNWNSDNIIRNLRQPNDTRHYIPKGGMFRYVSSANYFGELLEWIGFAILTWSAAGAIFAWWTFANLAPRAWRIHRQYSKEFGEEFTQLKLKRIIPYIF